MSGETVLALKRLGDAGAAVCVDGVCTIPQAPGLSTAGNAAGTADSDSVVGLQTGQIAGSGATGDAG